MYKRTFKVLLAASVIALAIPVQAAVGMPTSDSGGPVVVQKSTPVVGRTPGSARRADRERNARPVAAESER